MLYSLDIVCSHISIVGRRIISSMIIQSEQIPRKKKFNRSHCFKM